MKHITRCMRQRAQAEIRATFAQCASDANRLRVRGNGHHADDQRRLDLELVGVAQGALNLPPVETGHGHLHLWEVLRGDEVAAFTTWKRAKEPGCHLRVRAPLNQLVEVGPAPTY